MTATLKDTNLHQSKNKHLKSCASSINQLKKLSQQSVLTDCSSLYTILYLTQNLPTSVIGTEGHILIKFNFDLYNRTIKIQESVSKNLDFTIMSN